MLIIDDDESIRSIVGQVLESNGFFPLYAEDGEAGMKILEGESEPPCVILLDMMMPGMNGWQFLDLQRGDPQFSNIPVIVCSAYAETAKSVHGAPFIPKPIEMSSLVRAVHAFCA